MADETDPTQPAAPAQPVPDPSSAPVPEPAVVPDPSPGDTPSTSPAPSEPATGERVPQDPAQLADQFKKEELQAAAAVQGVDVPASATKADIAEAIVGQQTPGVTPVVVDNFTTRGDDDAHLGSWVDVVGGEYAGRFGAYFETASYDPATGYPSVVHVRSRDAANEILTVNYSDIRPSERGGGR